MPTSAPPVTTPVREPGTGHLNGHKISGGTTTSTTGLEARPLLFESSKPIPGTYDEMVDADGQPRPQARRAVRTLDALTPTQFAQYQSLAELSLYSQGVAFSVYSDQRGTEKIFPICLVPRVIAAGEWARV